MLFTCRRMRRTYFGNTKNSKSGSIGSGSVVGNVAEELADVFIYVCSLANMHGVDLEHAFRNKEEEKQTTDMEKIIIQFGSCCG